MSFISKIIFNEHTLQLLLVWYLSAIRVTTYMKYIRHHAFPLLFDLADFTKSSTCGFPETAAASVLGALACLLSAFPLTATALLLTWAYPFFWQPSQKFLKRNTRRATLISRVCISATSRPPRSSVRSMAVRISWAIMAITIPASISSAAPPVKIKTTANWR